MGLVQRNGIYYAEFFNSTKNPRSKRFSLRTRRKKTASKRLARLEMDFEKGIFDPWVHAPDSYLADDNHAPVLRSVDVVEMFIESRILLGRSGETVRTYREVLGGLFNGMSGQTLDAPALPDQIMNFVYDSEIAPATRLKRYGHVRTFFRWSSSKGYVIANPLTTIQKPQPGLLIPKAISLDEVQLICDAMLSDYSAKRKARLVKEGEIIWRKPLFQFAFLTGMRASELARMRWKDMNLSLRLVTILEQKNGHQQTIPLSKRALRVIESLGEREGQEFVFLSPRGNPTSRSSKRFAERSSEAFRFYRRAAGLPEGICFHSLRHGFCTALANAGKAGYVIKAAARHKDISTSMRYVHVSQRKLLCDLDDAFD